MKCFLFCANLVSSSVPQLESEPEVIQISKAPKDVPFAIPEKWKWVNLHSTLKAISDGSHNPPPNVGHGVPVLSAKNVINGIIDTNSVTRWTTEEQWSIEDKKIHIQSGDVLLTIVGTIGRTAVVPNDCEKFMLQRSVCVMKPKECVNPEFLALILNSPSLFEWIMDHASGTAQKGIYLKTVKQIPIPLPSIEEQHRIVEKIKKLFEQIDSAEKAYNELSGPLSERFRQLCLEKAIQGKLVPQLESEPEVEQIGDAPEEIPFEIPKKWKWCHVLDVVCTNPKVAIADPNMEISFIPMAAVSAGYLSQILLKEKRPWNTVRNGYTKFADGDVLVAKITPCFQNRKSVIANSLSNGVGCGSSEFHVLRAREGILDRKFLLMFVKSPWFIAYGVENFKGTAGQQRVGSADLKNCPFPLPPLAEQRRIVSKLSGLLPIVERLESDGSQIV